MPALPFLLAAVLTGAFVSLQPAMNARLAGAIDSAMGAASISIFVSLMLALLLLILTGGGTITRETLTSVPWWVYLGGPVGTAFVAAGVFVAPVTGAMLFFVCVVAGQLIGSMLADHFGAFGLEVRQISPQRIIGIALVLAGAVLVQRG